MFQRARSSGRANYGLIFGIIVLLVIAAMLMLFVYKCITSKEYRYHYCGGKCCDVTDPLPAQPQANQNNQNQYQQEVPYATRDPMMMTS